MFSIGEYRPWSVGELGRQGLRAVVALGVALLSVSLAGCRVSAAQGPPSASSAGPAANGPTMSTPVGSTGTTASVQPVGIAGTWHLVFDDEFSGGALDTAKWSTGWLGSGITPDVSSLGLDCDDPQQVSVTDGSLNLALVSKPEVCGGVTQEYATGAVNTDGKASFLFGTFEARIYLPATANGYIADWPAWWADGQHWPTDGELDVMEGLSGVACYHLRYSAAGARGSCADGGFSGWHTYAADWEPGSVTYYYDGVQVGQITNAGITPAPLFLVLDYSVHKGSAFTQVPSTMRVDYVRVWQR